KSLTIQNSNAGMVTLDGNNTNRVAVIANSAAVTLRHLTIQHGRAAAGGGIAVDVFGALQLDRVVVRDNRAVGPDGTNSSSSTATTGGQAGLGGGVWTAGGTNLIVSNSSFIGNIAQGGAGGSGQPSSPPNSSSPHTGAGGGGGFGGGVLSGGLTIIS